MLSALERSSLIISLAISAGGTSIIWAISKMLRIVAEFSRMINAAALVTGVMAP